MRPVFAPASPRQKARVILLCREIGLEHAERRELTEYVLNVPGGSLRALSASQARRLIDVLVGYQAICTLVDHLRTKPGSRSYVRPEPYLEPADVERILAGVDD